MLCAIAANRLVQDVREGGRVIVSQRSKADNWMGQLERMYKIKWEV